jgi:hypothetical protein
MAKNGQYLAKSKISAASQKFNKKYNKILGKDQI